MEFDSTTPEQAAVFFFADAHHRERIAVFKNVHVGDLMTLSAEDLPAGKFPAFTYIRLVATSKGMQMRREVKLNTTCAGMSDLLGAQEKEFFVESFVDGNGNVSENSCGSCKTLMCNDVKGKDSYARMQHYSHPSHKTVKSIPRVSGYTRCIKNEDVNAKLRTGDWTLGPCVPKCGAIACPVIPDNFMLTASPNPFIDSTTINFKMPDDERITLTVYNVEGEVIAEIFNGDIKKEKLYEVKFFTESDGEMFFYRLVTASGDVHIRKLIHGKTEGL